MPKKLQLGLIGKGRWGTNIYNTVEKITGTPPLLLKERGQGGEVDGILIATPGSTHAEIALPYIKQGIPVFIEKPMTTSFADAKKIAKAAEKSKSLVMTGHIHLYNPAYLKAKQLAAKAGPIRSLYFEGMNNGPIRDDMSALWDWAPHDVAMALDLLGSIPTHVQAWGQKILRPKTELYDAGQIRLFYANNIQVVINVSWLSPEKRKKLVIVTEKKQLVFDDTLPKPKNRKSPLELEINDFIKAIKTGQEPVSSLQIGIDVVKIIDKAHQSINLDGKKMKL